MPAWVRVLTQGSCKDASDAAFCAPLHSVQKPDKTLGFVQIPTEEVVRNKSMKDQWPLLDADKGDIVLA